MYPQRNFVRTGGWSERGLSNQSTDIASLPTFSIRFPRMTVSGKHKSVSLLALEAHWAFWRGNVHSVCPLRSAGARSGARGSMFVVVTSMRWSYSEVFLEGNVFKDLQHLRKLVYLPSCCWRRWVGNVAGMTLESWDGNCRSCWHRFHGGGLLQRERASHWSLSWSVVLCCKSTPAHGGHISKHL